MSTWQKLGTCVSLFVSVTCLCWSLAHAEQLLFSCLCSKVSICNYVTFHITQVTCHMSNAYVDSWHMLNNFCFDVFAQKWVFVIMSHVTCRMWHETCLMSNAYVDPWDMLNNFCFQVYAQKWVLVIMSHVTCHILHVTWQIAHVTCHI